MNTEIANIIRRQIGVWGLATLGAHKLAAVEDGFTFLARILPFRKDGTRGLRPRNMRVMITLNGLDTYDVKVYYRNRGELVTHWEGHGYYFDQLTPLMIALDYDGEETLNPNYV